MRAIDADALMNDICESLNQMTNIRIAVDGEWLWGKLNDALDNAPTIEPQRMRGRWHQRIYKKVEMMVCSECGNEFSYDAETGVRDYNFCPNCGAEMDGEEDE